MKLFQNLFTWKGMAKKSSATVLDDIVLALRGASRTSNSGVVVNWTTAVQVAAVFGCVRVLAESVAQLPLILNRDLGDGNYQAAKDHALYKILKLKPNPWQSSFEFRETMMWHMVLTGNAFAFINRLSNGNIAELIPVQPQQVNVRRLSDYSLVYEITDDFGNRAQFEQDEILHICGPSWNGWIGLDPVRLAREAIGLGLATEEHGARMFSNGARIGGVLETEQTLKKDVIERIRAQFEEIYGGLGNAGKTAILEQALKWKPVSMNAEEAQFLETRKFQVIEICRIFRVPPHLVFDLERSTNNNIEHQGLEFVQYTLMPWLVRWEQAIACQMLNDDEQEELYAHHELDELLRADIVSRYTAYGTARQWGFLCVDEIRKKEGLPPLPNGRGKIYLQPVNMVDSANPVVPQNSGDTNQDPNGSKMGRVISGANEKLIVSARDNLTTVLTQLEPTADQAQ
jgi:HK97 family phage portal protein